MARAILLSDLNNFYASVECLHRPELRDKPVAVGGDIERRHGIILAKNGIAKAAGVKTAETLSEARTKCPGLIILPPNYHLYHRYSRWVKNIYLEYTDMVEPYGLDECWLDVSSCHKIFGSGKQIADSIRERVKKEVGLTCSIGVSYNKIFAKLGSDYKKPDATTEISKENYKDIAWPLPVGELLYVGAATERRLRLIGIRSIGQLAQADPERIQRLLGKMGSLLWVFANGYDRTPVNAFDAEPAVKSIGNSITTVRDMADLDDVGIVFTVLAESVATRLREHGFKAATVQICLRDKQLKYCQRQATLPQPTFLANVLTQKALEMIQSSYRFDTPLRSIGLRGCNLVPANASRQITIFCDEKKQQKQECLAFAMDGLRQRYGFRSVRRAVELSDKALSDFAPKEEHWNLITGQFK